MVSKATIARLTQNPKAVLSSMNEKEIAEILTYLNDLYYNTGDSPVSDDVYDVVKEHLGALNPSHKILKAIGAPIVGNVRKEKLPYFMGSMDKIKSDSSTLESFKSKHPGSYVVSDKLDGNSALLYFKNGRLSIYSRGNGVEGQNISDILLHIAGIPSVAIFEGDNLDGVAIRGELIISKADFDKVADQGANARNMVAGLINAKKPNLDLLPMVQFVAYSLVHPSMKPSDQMTWLQRHGFRTVHNISLSMSDFSFTRLSDILVDRRSNSPFEVDGIIVGHDSVHELEVGKNPSYAFAFKNVLTQEVAEVVVTNIEWNISKDGYIKPVIEFNPVKLAGVTIKRATGFNGEYVQSNVIGPGARIVITRSGDVIPYIVRILTPSSNGKPQMPDVAYDWNETGKEILVKGSNAELDYKQVENFFTKIKVHGLSTGNIRKLYDNGLNSSSKILKASEVALSKILGEKIGKKLFIGLEDLRTKMDCVSLMDASNMFGRGFGEKRLRSILDAIPALHDVNSKYVPSKGELLSVPGVSDITAEKFVFGLKRFRMFMNDNKIDCQISFKVKRTTSDEKEDDGPTKKRSSPTRQDLNAQVILFTGFRDKEMEKKIEARGGSVVSSFSKKVTILVAKDTSSNSGKVQQARASGSTTVLSVEAFKELHHL